MRALSSLLYILCSNKYLFNNTLVKSIVTREDPRYLESGISIFEKRFSASLEKNNRRKYDADVDDEKTNMGNGRSAFDKYPVEGSEHVPMEAATSTCATVPFAPSILKSFDHADMLLENPSIKCSINHLGLIKVCGGS
jgi:hypothetical protein